MGGDLFGLMFAVQKSQPFFNSHTQLGSDYMVSFSLGWNFAPPTELKYCCDYMLNFSQGAKRKFPWEIFTEVRKHSLCTCWRSYFGPTEIPFRLQETFSDSRASLAGLKILARFENTGLGISARAELRPGLNPSPCNRQFGFQRICFRSRSEARDEICLVIGSSEREIWLSFKRDLSWSEGPKWEPPVTFELVREQN